MQREETLLNLSLYIAHSGNVLEAYETLNRYILNQNLSV